MIENTLLHFKTKTAFNTQLEADNIKNDSITFIQDTKQIWTHGTYFDCDNSAGNIKVSDELAASAGVANKNVEAMLSALVVGYNWFYETALPSKQDNITDLDNIRSGASLGATAVQPSQLSSVAISGSYNDLSNKPTIPFGDYVTLDTEQTITGKKYINDTTFRFKNSENTIETVVTNRAISMQPMDGVEKPSSILNIQSMTGGKIHITNSNSKNQTVWPKQLSVTNLKYDTQDRCGVYVDTDENRQQVVVGYFKNVNGVFYTLSSLSTGKYAEIIADCLYLHSGASSNDELNAAAFKWDNTTNTLDIKRAYYNNGSIETDDVKLTLNGKEVATITDVINHGTSDSSFVITSNEYHVWGQMSTLSLTLAEPSDSTIYNEYAFEFISGPVATTLSLPSTIRWISAPDIQPNMIYQVSIVNNLGVIGGFSNE